MTKIKQEEPKAKGKRNMIKILFVCHGNICRSTMAESVMTYLVAGKNLQNQFQIASAATSREEIGNSPHYGTVAKLRAVGIPLVPHRAVQMTRGDAHYEWRPGAQNLSAARFRELSAGYRRPLVYGEL